MVRYIETKKGLKTLLERMDVLKGASKYQDFDYWKKVVEGCIEENLAMDEVDYENAQTGLDHFGEDSNNVLSY